MIEVKTILNETLMRKFGEEQSKSKIWVPLTAMLVLIAIGVVCMFDKDLGVVFGIPVIIIGLLLPLLYFILTRSMINRMIKSAPLIKNGTTQIFRFTESGIMLNESSKYVSANDVRVSYDALIKARESDTSFYLYVGKTQAYILDAKGFTIGTRRDLHNLLQDKLGSKFKYKKSVYAKK